MIVADTGCLLRQYLGPSEYIAITWSHHFIDPLKYPVQGRGKSENTWWQGMIQGFLKDVILLIFFAQIWEGIVPLHTRFWRPCNSFFVKVQT